MTFVNPAASVAVTAVDSHHLLGLYRAFSSRARGPTDQGPAWLRERQWDNWPNCLSLTPRGPPELLFSQGRVTPDDVFPWSIVFDSSCKTPRIHARPAATSFWTQRGSVLRATWEAAKAGCGPPCPFG